MTGSWDRRKAVVRTAPVNRPSDLQRACGSAVAASLFTAAVLNYEGDIATLGRCCAFRGAEGVVDRRSLLPSGVPCGMTPGVELRRSRAKPYVNKSMKPAGIRAASTRLEFRRSKLPGRFRSSAFESLRCWARKGGRRSATSSALTTWQLKVAYIHPRDVTIKQTPEITTFEPVSTERAEPEHHARGVGARRPLAIRAATRYTMPQYWRPSSSRRRLVHVENPG